MMNVLLFNSNTACNIVFIFESGMDFVQQVYSTVKFSFCEVRKLSMTRKCLNTEAAETLTHAFISSHLDFCNSL